MAHGIPLANANHYHSKVAILKMFIFAITKENKKKEIYYQRYSGLVNSIFGKSSWYRPKV